MLTVQEEILLKNYDINFIKTFSSIDLKEIGLSDILAVRLLKANVS